MRQGTLSYRGKAWGFILFTRALADIYGDARVVDIFKNRGGLGR